MQKTCASPLLNPDPVTGNNEEESFRDYMGKLTQIVTKFKTMIILFSVSEYKIEILLFVGLLVGCLTSQQHASIEILSINAAESSKNMNALATS